MTARRIINGCGIPHAIMILVAFFAAGAFAAAEAPFALFAASDTVRVFEDGFGWSADAARSLSVSGLRNEIVSSQCVISAREALLGVTVSVGPLRHENGTDLIPADNVRWRFVAGVAIDENTPKLIRGDIVRSAPARFPDVLIEDRKAAVAAGAHKAVYLTLRIPATATAGQYAGEVAVTSGARTVALPLRLTVFPLTLPDERHVFVAELFTTSVFGQHHGIDPSDPAQFEQMLRTYAENMADHRQNVFLVPLDLVASTLAVNGTLRFDYARFDRFAQIFWDTGRMDALETGFVGEFGPGRWASREIRLKEFMVNDEASATLRPLPGREFLPQFLPSLVKHLRKKGWLEKTLFHVADEPSNHNALAWLDISRFVHRHAPELRRIEAIETPHLSDQLEVWGPKLDHLLAWEGAYELARRRGAELWFYTVGVPQRGSLPNRTVDVALIESRVLHWINYRYQLRGYMHWGLNGWTDDPINAPGKTRGSVWHVYPKRGGLMDSMRWEQKRAGIQDYECLWLLQDGINRLRVGLSPRVAELIDPVRRGVEIASRVVRTYSEFTRDPEVLHAARQQAIDEVLELNRSPRVIVQTNPTEHSLQANDSPVDVHGWAEPGTQIRINGKETPIEADGLFFQDVRLAADGTVTVDAQLRGGQKRIVRRFRLLVPSP